MLPKTALNVTFLIWSHRGHPLHSYCLIIFPSNWWRNLEDGYSWSFLQLLFQTHISIEILNKIHLTHNFDNFWMLLKSGNKIDTKVIGIKLHRICLFHTDSESHSKTVVNAFFFNFRNTHLLWISIIAVGIETYTGIFGLNTNVAKSIIEIQRHNCGNLKSAAMIPHKIATKETKIKNRSNSSLYSLFQMHSNRYPKKFTWLQPLHFLAFKQFWCQFSYLFIADTGNTESDLQISFLDILRS